MYYVYFENCEGDIRVIRCGGKIAAYEICHAITNRPLQDRASISQSRDDISFVTTRQTRIKAAIYRPYIEAQDDDTLQILKQKLEVWLQGQDFAPVWRRAIDLVNDKLDRATWWFGFDDCYGRTSVYHPGV